MKNINRFILAFGLLGTFLIWTLLVHMIDVQPIGPQDSLVGLAALNKCFHELTGVHMLLYHLTDWLSLVPLSFVAGFALLGLRQWLQRKSIWKVDSSILLLGIFYILVFASFLLFENLVINYRPVLIQGVLEASYPSSTTMLALCVMPTAMMQLHFRIQNSMVKSLLLRVLAVFTVFLVIGRVLSGVHWISDIIGGALLSAGLVTLYWALCSIYP